MIMLNDIYICSDLFEVLHETVSAVSFPNKVKPSDVLGAMTYILSKRSLDTGGVNSLEEVTVCTVGFKNIDVQLLNGVELPETLFQSGTDLKQACWFHDGKLLFNSSNQIFLYS